MRYLYCMILVCSIALPGVSPARGETIFEAAKRLQVEEQKEKALKAKNASQPKEKEKEKEKEKPVAKQAPAEPERIVRIKVFSFHNFSDNPGNDYISGVIADLLSQKLAQSGYLLSEELKGSGEKAITADRQISYSNYYASLGMLKKISARYAVDFAITGYYLVQNDSIAIIANLYDARRDKNIDFSISNYDYKNKLNTIADELDFKIEGEIRRAIREMKPDGRKRPDGDKKLQAEDDLFFGVGIRYGLFSPIGKWQNRAFSHRAGRVVTAMGFWDLDYFTKVKTIPFIRDLSIQFEMDMYQGTVYKTVFSSSDTEEYMRFHAIGFLPGVMYRYCYRNIFAFSAGTGIGFARSQTTDDVSNRIPAFGYLVPPRTKDESYDFYCGASVLFDINFTKNLVFSGGISYRLFTYSPHLLNVLFYQWGIGLRL
jgi:hypothetical protein